MFYRAAPVSTIPAGQGTSDDVGLAGADAAGLPGAARHHRDPGGGSGVAGLLAGSRPRAIRTALVVAGNPPGYVLGIGCCS